MFDRVTYVPRVSRTEYVTCTVHEHRAPTDKSVELLKEFEKAATDKIEKSVNLTSNEFSCVVHQLKDFVSGETSFKAVFELNGKRMTAEARTRTDRLAEPIAFLAEASLRLRDKIATAIANECLQGINI